MGKRELDFESLMAGGPKLISFGLIHFKRQIFNHCDYVSGYKELKLSKKGLKWKQFVRLKLVTSIVDYTAKEGI